MGSLVISAVALLVWAPERPIPMGQFQQWSIWSITDITFIFQKNRVSPTFMAGLLLFFNCFSRKIPPMLILFVREFEAQFCAFSLPPPLIPLIEWLNPSLEWIEISI
jgi:hypothetical protein